jgi:hypothetical protein
MAIPKWQYIEPDHPGADFDALAESYDPNMQKYWGIKGEIQEVWSSLTFNLTRQFLRSAPARAS